MIANETNAETSTGGVFEMDISNPTIALQGSGTADAPYLLLHMDATGQQNVTLSFLARELDTSNAAQQIAVQYRIGESGSFTNLPTGYIDDASHGMGEQNLVTVVLDAAANGAAQIQIRIITTNAVGSDSLIGIDDITVTSDAIGGGNTAPNFTGLDATPTYVEQGAAFIIDNNATVSDAELDALGMGLGNYSGASLQVADAALSGASVFNFAFDPDVECRAGRQHAPVRGQHDRHNRHRCGRFHRQLHGCERHHADDCDGQPGPADVDLRQHL